MSELKCISKLLELQDWNVSSCSYDHLNNSIVFDVVKSPDLGCECSYCGNVELFAFDKLASRKVRDLSAFGKKFI